MSNTIDQLKELNFQRKQNNIDELFFREATLIDNKLFMRLAEKNFLFVFDLSNNTFITKQIYINTMINDVVLKLKTGVFGDIGSPFAAVGYTSFNELEMYMRWLQQFECAHNTHQLHSLTQQLHQPRNFTRSGYR